MDPTLEQAEPELYPAKVGQLPPKYVRKAETELSETPERRESAVREVRDLMRREASIKEEWFTDENIIMFLRCKKYDVQKTFSSIKRTVVVIKKHAKLFDRIDNVELAELTNDDILRILPYRDEDGSVVILSKLRKWEPSVLDFEKAVLYQTMILWHSLSDPMTQVNGMRFIYDFKAPLFKYLRFTTPFKIYFVYQFSVEIVPIRVKFAHGVNPNALSRIFVPTFLALQPEKIRKRTKLHTDPAELLDYLPTKLVPNEYGGQMTQEDRMCSWGKEIKIPDYVENILKSVKTSS